MCWQRWTSKTGKPLVELILDKAGQKGTGVWSAIVAQQMGVPATAIEGAVAARSISARKDERVAAEAIYGKRSDAKADVTLADLEKALLAGKIVSYAQGFAVIAKASEENGWGLPLATIAKIWRAGCIIRSRFLDQMSAAYAKGGNTNLLVVPDFVAMMKDSHPSLRKMVAAAAHRRIPDDLPLGGAELFRQLSPGAGHRQPDPGPARFLRRPWLRDRRARQRPARQVAEHAGQVIFRHRRNEKGPRNAGPFYFAR